MPLIKCILKAISCVHCVGRDIDEKYESKNKKGFSTQVDDIDFLPLPHCRKYLKVHALAKIYVMYTCTYNLYTLKAVNLRDDWNFTATLMSLLCFCWMQKFCSELRVFDLEHVAPKLEKTSTAIEAYPRLMNFATQVCDAGWRQEHGSACNTSEISMSQKSNAFVVVFFLWLVCANPVLNCLPIEYCWHSIQNCWLYCRCKFWVLLCM